MRLCFGVRFKTAFLTDLNARLDNCNISWLKLSTALDPRFKSLKCLPRTERDAIWNKIEQLISAAGPHSSDELSSQLPEPACKKRRLFDCSSESEDEAEQQSHASLTVARYRSECEIDDKADPLHWWHVHAGAYPALAALALKYLATPATTVPCERLFSQSGIIVNKKRASLTGANVNKLVCLNNWFKKA